VEQLGKFANHSRMQRQFGFFEKKRPFAFEHRPHEPKQPKRPIRQLRLILTSIMRAPVLEAADNVRIPLPIHLHFESSKLWNSVLQHRANSTEPGVSCPLLLIPDTLHDVPSVRIILDRRGREFLRLPDNLRNDVLVRNRLEEVRHFPKVSVGENLL